jgi:hypothetical protein
MIVARNHFQISLPEILRPLPNEQVLLHDLVPRDKIAEVQDQRL